MTITAQTPDTARSSGAERPAVPVRLDVERHGAAFVRALGTLDAAATRELDRTDVDPQLRELVRIRVSQLNGCAYCIDMHSTDARAIGETEQRLSGLTAWAEDPYYTVRERAALAFAEAVTLVAQTHVPTEAYDAVAEHYSPDEIAALLALITAINAWNTVAVSTRAWTPGSYQR